jgi:hypothetical protein
MDGGRGNRCTLDSLFDVSRPWGIERIAGFAYSREYIGNRFDRIVRRSVARVNRPRNPSTTPQTILCRRVATARIPASPRVRQRQFGRYRGISSRRIAHQAGEHPSTNSRAELRLGCRLRWMDASGNRTGQWCAVTLFDVRRAGTRHATVSDDGGHSPCLMASRADRCRL